MAEQKATTAAQVVASLPQVPAAVVKPEKLRIKKRLTLDATSIVRLGPCVVRVVGEMEEMTMPPKAAGAEPGRATGLPVQDVFNNNEYLLILNAVMVSAFVRSIPPLSGRLFAMRPGEIKVGKTYRMVDIFEVYLEQ